MLMAYMVSTYDMKWPEEDVLSKPSAIEQGYRPPNHWFNFTNIPNRYAHIMIRKRV